ncbi:MAG: hypothetical protein ACOX7R_10545 [Acetivibrionales bacterium]
MSLEDFRPMMKRCSNCLGCKWIPFDKIKSQRFGENCPSVCYYNFNTYSARGRFQLGLALLDGDADYSETVIDVIHNCLTCGSCDISCKVCRYNLEPLEYTLELKADAVRKGKVLPRQKAVIESLEKENTMIPGKLKANRGDWTNGIRLKDISKEKADTAFFPGCKYSYDEELRTLVRSTAELFIKAGVDIGFLGNADNCCAGRAYQMGFRDEFDRQGGCKYKSV